MGTMTLVDFAVNALAIGACAFVLVQFVKHYGDK